MTAKKLMVAHMRIFVGRSTTARAAKASDARRFPTEGMGLTGFGFSLVVAAELRIVHGK